jgi:Zn-dependent protease
MFGKGIPLFKLFGFEVRIDLSWLVLGLLITWTLAKGVFPHYYENLPASTYWFMGVGGAVGLFVSIVFHELWHSLVARKYGLQMKGITLFIFGGVAHMTEEPPSPRAEFAMAIAGPVSSVVLALILFVLVKAGEAGGMSTSVTGVAEYLMYLNLILAGFNMVPAFPLDGGRVLRSILWGWKKNIRWATAIAARIGGVFGLFLIFMGIFVIFQGNLIGGLWWFLIGMFMRNAAQASYQQLLIRQTLEGEKVRRFMAADPVTVTPSTTVEELIEDYVYKHHYKMFPVVDNGNLVGCVTINQIKEIPKEARARTTLREIVDGCSSENTISPDADAVKALSLMNRSKNSRLLVREGSKLVGVLSLKDMLDFLALKIDLEGENL